MISRYDRGAQTLADLDYAPFPDISRAIPELVGCILGPATCSTARAVARSVGDALPAASKGVRLHTRLHTEPEGQKVETPETFAVSRVWSVGAIGIEPTTPTVSR